MTQFIYAGEADGGRVVRLGAPVLTKITSAGTDPVLFRLQSWDFYPAGPSGICLFRLFSVRLIASAGYDVRVTPYVDGEALDPQDFSSSDVGESLLQAWFAARGTYCSVVVEQLQRLGEFELVDVQVGFRALRAQP